LNLCWAEDASDAKKTVLQVWPNGGIPGQLAQELPMFTHFEDAASLVREEDATKSVPCGPDVKPVLDSVKEFLDAGYDHLYFHQIGPDQHGFLKFWSSELQPALAELRST
jgi:coenzyme F420-dependent glucose-6-phosphate dehydrogenase